MSGSVDLIRTVFDPVLDMPEARARVGSALWLYVLLVSRAGDRGRVIRTTCHLAEDLSVDENSIRDWLERLSKAKLIRIQSPPPFLVVKLRMWPGSKSISRIVKAQPSNPSSCPHREVPVSSSEAAAASKQNEDGGLGEGEMLLDETLTVLGKVDRQEIKLLLDRYPDEVIRKALTRVCNTPDSQIRKSREALFRYLLTRFSQNES